MRRRVRRRLRVCTSGLCPAPLLCGPCNHTRPDPAQIRLCQDWLIAWARPTKTIRKRHSSYTWKHAVERYSVSVSRTGLREYVSPGAFIEAAIREGFRIVPTHVGSPNAFLNLSVRRGAP
jgi:hypothetical protein